MNVIAAGSFIAYVGLISQAAHISKNREIRKLEFMIMEVLLCLATAIRKKES